jgi:hypothetical protein
MVAAFFLVSVLFATSRPQNALPGFLLAFLGWRLARYDRDRRRQRRLVGLAAVAVCLVVVAYSRSTPKLLRRIYLFNTVFRVMLPSSPDPRQDLAQLGLPPDFARLTGVWGFGPDAPVDDEDFQRIFGRVSYGKLAAFYLARPARLRSALEAGAPEAFQMRPYRLGNFARESGKPAGALSRSFSAWSRAKARFAPGRLWFVIAYLLVSLAAGVELRVRGRTRALRAAAEIWIVLVLLAAFQFGIASVMTGAESRRSFFLFNVVFDVTLAALIVRLADLVGRRRTALEPAI